MRDIEWLDAKGKRAPIVISSVPHTPESILIIRDPFWGKMRSRSQPSRERQVTASSLQVRDSAHSQVRTVRTDIQEVGAADEITSRALRPGRVEVDVKSDSE